MLDDPDFDLKVQQIKIQNPVKRPSLQIPAPLATTTSGLFRICAASTVLVAGTTLPFAGAANAQATFYTYNIYGTFGNNTGPDSKGKFSGKFVWDPTAGGSTAPTYPNGFDPATSLVNKPLTGYSVGNGSGGFSYWKINMYKPDGTTFLYQFDSTQATSKCFGSPLESGLAAAGTYYEATPGLSAVCTGSPVYHPGDAKGATTFLAFHNEGPHSWIAQGNTFTADYSYFRVGMTGDPAAGTLSSNNVNSQSAEYYGWGIILNSLNPTTDDPVNAKSMTCVGDNAFPNNAPTGCPYAGNNINLQGLGSATTDLQIQFVPEGGVPAPLPLAGAVPLGVTLRRLSRKRAALVSRNF